MKDSYKTGTKTRQICNREVLDIALQYSTPLYVVYEEILRDNYDVFSKALENLYSNHMICYAIKANSNTKLVEILGGMGAGADVASEWELKIALCAGIPPDRIRANGNCKTKEYLYECISRGIVINVDPESELEIINNLCHEMGNTARINLRLSGFPIQNITSSSISTSGMWSKFGIRVDRASNVIEALQSFDCLVPNGLMVHLGSQITDISAYHLVMDRLVSLYKAAKLQGIPFKEIDLGGGYGVSYFLRDEWEELKLKVANGAQTGFTWGGESIGYDRNMRWKGAEQHCPFTPDKFFSDLLTRHTSKEGTLLQRLADLGNPRLIVEPGRSLVAEAGVTLVRVCHVGETPGGQSLVHVNAGVNHHSQSLVVPEQLHKVEVAGRIDSSEGFETFLAGNLCFTGDLFSRAKSRLNVKPRRGDVLIIYDTGAYADLFISNTNSFPRPAKVLVRSGGSDLVLTEREDEGYLQIG